MKPIIAISVLCLLLLLFDTGYCQRLPIENFNVDKGLSQSQVTSIVQDQQHYLWVGTIAGLNRFDGMHFETFSKKDGIRSNTITALYCSRGGAIWVGTSKGLSCYNGHRFENLALPAQDSHLNFRTITEDTSGTVYAHDPRNGIFVVKGTKIVKQTTPAENNAVTCLYRTAAGKVWAYIDQHGFYQLQNGQWTRGFKIPGLEQQEYVRLMTEGNGFYYAVTNKSTLLKIQNGVVVRRKKLQGAFRSAGMDRGNTLWLASAKGVLVVDAADLSVANRMNAANGLSDNMIHTIYKDTDQHLWIGSDGDGLFKYCGGAFIRYDKNTGLTGNVLMGFARAVDGRLWMGTREGKLLRFDPAKKTFTSTDYSEFSTYGINCLGADASGNIYAGTMDSRLLKIRGGHISEIILDRKHRPGIYTIRAYNNKVLVHTMEGGYWLEGDHVQKIRGLRSLVNSIQLSKDAFLMGSDQGLFFYSPGGAPKKLNIAGLDGVNISCFERYRHYIVIGSFDEGLFFWDQKTNQVIPCSKEQGLADNNIFALMNDSRGNLWAGSSSGVQEVAFNPATAGFHVKQYTVADGYDPSETNLNAMIEDQEHQIWIGTTKGAFRYNPADDKSRETGKPVTVMESVSFPGMQELRINSLPAREHLPADPAIAYTSNSISFSFKGIYLRDPASLLYAYQLAGYDTAFSPLQKETVLNYKNLPPGRYVFKVRSFTKNGIPSANTVEYPFTITTPYYQTVWFRVLVILGLILMGVLLQRAYANQKRKRAKEIRLIKEQEQQKIRTQTAEDFHDELGNKLTRISVLADVLAHKTDPADEERNKIILQIKSNALSLYAGTKEIIWSLTKESDNLKEVIHTIRQTAVELFSDTDVRLVFTGLEQIGTGTRIPAGYNRNIIMIFKELLSNTMRHAYATSVTIACKEEAGTVQIDFADDGIGFDVNGQTGNGLSNIRRRAGKINGTVTIHSEKQTGTTCRVIFNTRDALLKINKT
ncbi:ligand-binding sensor domain-containing protein [Niabella aurantiaca]|uniref:ligand-binding sensor domain-containing protein n=1 Tax=Niabella aurantiaca TaxID=379900 RepID=UPI00037FAED2|nr:sensor histidine kinase [Niabella aurantiaca]